MTSGSGVSAGLLPLEGAHNARDLGGFVTVDGRTVRAGRVFRADALARLTDGDLALLAGLGLRVEIDFRGQDERERFGVNRLPAGVREVHSAVVDESGTFLVSTLAEVIGSGDVQATHRVLGDGRADRIARDGVRGLVTQPSARAAFGGALRLIADAQPGAVMYNCMSGKDRTGWMSALLLGVLGVPDDAIVADYLASNEHLRAVNESVYAMLRERGIDIELIRPLTEQREDEIRGALAQLRTDHGSFDAYAQDALGLEPDCLERLRDQLLE